MIKYGLTVRNKINYSTMLRIYNSEEWLGKFNTHKEHRNIKKINEAVNSHVKYEQINE